MAVCMAPKRGWRLHTLVNVQFSFEGFGGGVDRKIEGFAFGALIENDQINSPPFEATNHR